MSRFVIRIPFPAQCLRNPPEQVTFIDPTRSSKGHNHSFCHDKTKGPKSPNRRSCTPARVGAYVTTCSSMVICSSCRAPLPVIKENVGTTRCCNSILTSIKMAAPPDPSRRWCLGSTGAKRGDVESKTTGQPHRLDSYIINDARQGVNSQ